MPQVLDDLIPVVNNAIGVMDSSKVLIIDFKDKLDQAVADALAGGATAEQLQPLQILSDELSAKTQELAAAVAANT